jgi:hypothetical protein
LPFLKFLFKILKEGRAIPIKNKKVGIAILEIGLAGPR